MAHVASDLFQPTLCRLVDPNNAQQRHLWAWSSRIPRGRKLCPDCKHKARVTVR